LLGYPVLVVKDLYYFREDGLDGLKAVQSFAGEQTNMTLIASFSITETRRDGDFGPYWARMRNLGSTTEALLVKSGYLAFFRSNIPPKD
jgi:hypothetical protein